MPLTDTLLHTFKPSGKVVKLYDGGGLLLRISPLRKKNRQFTYSRQGKQTTAGPGSYPAVTPKEARKKTLELRKALAQGKDPVRVKSEAREQAAADALTFEPVARERHGKHPPTWTPGHAWDNLNRLERFPFPAIGGLPIVSVNAPLVLDPLRRLEEAGILAAHGWSLWVGFDGVPLCCGVWYVDSDPCRDLRGALAPKVKRHHATITEPRRVGDPLRAIDGYQGAFVVRCALQLLPFVFVRSGELRGARWEKWTSPKRNGASRLIA